MDKVFKILVVFGLVMILIVYNARVKDKRYRDFYFTRKMEELPDGLLMTEVDQLSPRAAKDIDQQLFFEPGEGVVRVIEDLTDRLVAVISIGQRVHGLVFEPVSRLLYCCTTDGWVAIVKQVAVGEYRLMQRLEVTANAFAMGVDAARSELVILSPAGIDVYTNM